MATLVVGGAMLKCSVGSAPAVLQIQRSSSVAGAAQPVATGADKTGFKFGVCPIQGPTPVPCVPNIPGPWASSANVKAGGLPVLTSASLCQCAFGGTISVVGAGQPSIQVN